MKRNDLDMKLWKYNKVTGLWDYVRNVTTENKNQWLEVFEKAEPKENFKLCRNKPNYILTSI